MNVLEHALPPVLPLADRCPRAAELFWQGVEKRYHHGLQVAVAHRGEWIISDALGDNQPGDPLMTDMRAPWLSAGKPLTALALARLHEAGHLGWDDPVAQFVPGFGARGKADVTLKQLLTHTVPFLAATQLWPDADWSETIAALCDSPLDESPILADYAAYHPQTTWFILGEVVAKVSGIEYGAALRTLVLDPLGLSEVTSREGDATSSASPPARIYERVAGQLRELDWHEPPRAGRVSPGSTLRGPIHQLARVYQHLLQAWQGAEGALLQWRTVRELVQRQRVGLFDRTLQHVVDFGLGFLINSNRYGPETVPYGYGRHAGEATFGHGGAQSSQGYCDPERELVVAYYFNGRAGEGLHSRRVREFNTLLYEELGLAS